MSTEKIPEAKPSKATATSSITVGEKVESANATKAASKVEPARPNLKRKKESAKDVRKRRKIERAEKQKEDIANKRKQQLADGTFDWDAEAERAKHREMNGRLRTYIKLCEKQGMFTKEALLEHEAQQKTAKKEREALELIQARPETDDADSTKLDDHTGLHADRLQMINDPLKIEPVAISTRKLSYKAEKYMRESRKRELKRAERAKIEVELWPGAKPSTAADLAPEEVKERKAAEKAERKRIRDEKAAKQKAIDEAKAKEKAERLEAKRLRREAKFKERQEAVERGEMPPSWKDIRKGRWVEVEEEESIPVSNGVAATVNAAPIDNADASKLTMTDQPNNSPDVIMTDAPTVATPANPDELNADIIKLDVAENVPRVKKWRKKAPVEPPKPKKPDIPIGMSLDEYLVDLVKQGLERLAEKEAQMDALRKKPEEERTPAETRNLQQEQIRREENALVEQRATKKRLETRLPAVFGYEGSEPVIAAPAREPVPKPAPVSAPEPELSAEKLAQYTARAAEKGETLAEYMARRKAKKNAKHGTASDNVPDAPAASEVDTTLEVAAAVAEPEPADPAEDLPFIVDTVGDSTIAPINPELPSAYADLVSYTPTGKLVLPINPLIWEGRIVKELTKAERKARLEWLRLRRECRKELKGEPTMSLKERRKKRVEMKMAWQNGLAYSMLEKEGIKGKDVTKEQLKDTRRKAKRMLRAAKKGKEVEGLPESLRDKVDKTRQKRARKAAKRNQGRNN